MSSRINLLFSLPDDLITEIYGTFDPTYRIFHTPEFRKELAGAGWLNHHKKMIKSMVKTHMIDMDDEDDLSFKNEYGYIGEVEVSPKESKKIGSTCEDKQMLGIFPYGGKKALDGVKARQMLRIYYDVIGYDSRMFNFDENNIQIYMPPANGEYMFFKVLPLGATKKNCAFLRNPQRFDGFVCHEVTGKEDWIHGSDNVESRLINDHPQLVAQWRDGLCLYLCEG
jgi:hypothetical protein